MRDFLRRMDLRRMKKTSGMLTGLGTDDPTLWVP
jgi:hypothetical protein